MSLVTDARSPAPGPCSAARTGPHDLGVLGERGGVGRCSPLPAPADPAPSRSVSVSKPYSRPGPALPDIPGVAALAEGDARPEPRVDRSGTAPSVSVRGRGEVANGQVFASMAAPGRNQSVACMTVPRPCRTSTPPLADVVIRLTRQGWRPDTSRCATRAWIGRPRGRADLHAGPSMPREPQLRGHRPWRRRRGLQQPDRAIVTAAGDFALRRKAWRARSPLSAPRPHQDVHRWKLSGSRASVADTFPLPRTLLRARNPDACRRPALLVDVTRSRPGHVITVG